MEPEKRKNPKNFRLTDEAEALLLLLSKRLGVKQVGVMELAIRRLAQAEGVSLTAETPKAD
jgi:hypothetical protein